MIYEINYYDKDDSNASKQLDSVTWMDAQVKTVLRKDCIAIRLVKGTPQAEQFIQICKYRDCFGIFKGFFPYFSD